MNFKGAIFDLDGTLLDSMPIWNGIGEKYLLSKGIAPQENLSKRFREMDLLQAAEYYRERYGITDGTQEITRGIERLIEHFYRCEVTAKDGAKEFLERLKSANIRMCVATANSKELAVAALKHCGLCDYFEMIFTTNDMECGKNSPAIYDKALAFFGLQKQEVIVFEDALHAIQTAAKAGYTIAAVQDNSAKADEQEIKRIADFYISDYREVDFYV